MTQPIDRILQGGTVVTSSGQMQADVAIAGETICAIGSNLAADPETKIIDVTGKLLLPGAIDVHVHPVYVDNIDDCSRVAAYGGTTTLCHFVYAHKGQSLYDATAALLEEGQTTSRTDFGLHSAMFDAPNQILEIERTGYGPSREWWGH